MAKAFPMCLVLGLMIWTGPALAQKKSCDEFCIPRCSVAGGGAAKSACMARCVPSCNAQRASSGKTSSGKNK